MNVLEAGLRVKRNKIIQKWDKMNARASFFYSLAQQLERQHMRIFLVLITAFLSSSHSSVRTQNPLTQRL